MVGTSEKAQQNVLLSGVDVVKRLHVCDLHLPTPQEQVNALGEALRLVQIGHDRGLMIVRTIKAADAILILKLAALRVHHNAQILTAASIFV